MFMYFWLFSKNSESVSRPVIIFVIRPVKVKAATIISSVNLQIFFFFYQLTV